MTEAFEVHNALAGLTQVYGQLLKDLYAKRGQDAAQWELEKAKLQTRIAELERLVASLSANAGGHSGR